MIIDLENHMAVPEEVLPGTSKSGKLCERFWDTDGKLKIRKYQDFSNENKYLQFMDEAGIDIAVLTPNLISSLEQCKKWNDFCSNVVKQHPKRFVGFASVPVAGGKPALNELERAVKHLGLKGVHIWTQTGGYSLDSRELWPFYEKVARLAIPIDVHITEVPTGLDILNTPYGLYYVMAREVDMCVATFRLCLGGVLEDFPDLVFIMNHFGGGVSAMMERLDVYLDYVGPGWPSFYYGKPLITRPWREYFNKLYFNMAGREVGMATVKCALTTISPKKLMFATDWPFNFDYNPQGVKKYVEEIRKLDLPQEDIQGMLGGNASKLLGI